MDPSRANRFVYVEVRLPDDISPTHAESCFENAGWTFDSDADQRAYTLHIPLYCARPLALAVARNTLNDFSRTQVPLLVDNTRLVAPPVDRRQRSDLAQTEATPVEGDPALKPHQSDPAVTDSQAATGSRLFTLLHKMRWTVVAAAVVIALGMLYIAYLTFPGEGMRQFIQAIVRVILFLVALMGWQHLAVLYPKIRFLWSIASLSLLFAVSAVLGQLLLSTWESHFRLPPDAVNYPAWFRLVSAGFSTLVILAAIFLTIGLVAGWLAYFGVISFVPQGVRIILLAVLTVLYPLVALVNGLELTLYTSRDVISGWNRELVENKTPVMTADFLYRACIVPVYETEADTSETIEPVTVIQGTDDRYWIWDFEGDVSDQEPQLTFNERTLSEVATEDVEVRRAADGDDACDEA